MSDSMFDLVTLDALRVDRQTTLGARVAEMIAQARRDFDHERVKFAEATITITINVSAIDDVMLVAPSAVKYRGPKLRPFATTVAVANDGRVLTQDLRQKPLPGTEDTVRHIGLINPMKG